MSLKAYRRTVAQTGSPREIERRIMSEITAELAVHQEHFDKSEKMSERITILAGSLRSALTRNLKLWSALRADLTLDENQLPLELRANLVSLALFVERQSNAVIGGTGQLKPLIDINKSIMAGLAGQVPEAA